MNKNYYYFLFVIALLIMYYINNTSFQIIDNQIIEDDLIEGMDAASVVTQRQGDTGWRQNADRNPWNRARRNVRGGSFARYSVLQSSVTRSDAARNKWKTAGNNAILNSESHKKRVGRKKGSKALGKNASIKTANLLNMFRTAGGDAARSSNPLRGKPFKGPDCAS